MLGFPWYIQVFAARGAGILPAFFSCAARASARAVPTRHTSTSMPARLYEPEPQRFACWALSPAGGGESAAADSGVDFEVVPRKVFWNGLQSSVLPQFLPLGKKKRAGAARLRAEQACRIVQPPLREGFGTRRLRSRRPRLPGAA